MHKHSHHFDITIDLPFRLKAFLVSLSLVLGMAASFIMAGVLIAILEPTVIALKLTLGSLLDFKTAIILIVLGGLWFANLTYSVMSKYVARQIDTFC